MAKRIKFALEMKDGIQVRSLEDLRKYFDLDKTIGYFVDGKLLKSLSSLDKALIASASSS